MGKSCYACYSRWLSALSLAIILHLIVIRTPPRDPIVEPAVPQRVLNPASRVMSEFLHDYDEVMMRNIHTE